jgi:hypothetical protein
MIITGSSIRNLDKYLDESLYGNVLIFGVQINSLEDQILGKIGFPSDIHIGDSILPLYELGPVSKFNAEGKEIIHKDQPMETAYRQTEWHWKEWRGKYGSEEQSKIVDVPYDRYPRTFISPPSIELTISKTASNQLVILSNSIILNLQNKNLVIHIINLFLEIFGYCEVLIIRSKKIVPSPVRKLNWSILSSRGLSMA